MPTLRGTALILTYRHCSNETEMPVFDESIPDDIIDDEPAVSPSTSSDKAVFLSSSDPKDVRASLVFLDENETSATEITETIEDNDSDEEREREIEDRDIGSIKIV